MKKIVTILLIGLITKNLYSQDSFTLDSLNVKLENSKSDSSRINALLGLYRYYQNNDNEQALKYSLEALNHAKDAKLDKYILRSLQYVGITYMHIGNYNQATNYLIEMLGMAQEQNNSSELLLAYNGLGIVHDRIRKYDEALNYYFKAMNIFIENPSYHEEFKIQVLYNNIGNIYQTRNDVETSKEYYLKALEQAIAANDQKTSSIIYNNLGKVMLVEDSLDKAFDFMKKSHDIRLALDDQRGLGVSFYFLANYYNAAKNYPKSIEYGKKALHKGKEVNALNISMPGAYVTHLAFDNLNQTDSAFHYYKIYKSLNDSLINKGTYSEIERLKLQHQYEAEEKQRLIEAQKQKFSYIIVMAIVMSGFVIIFLLYILLKSRNRRIELEKNQLEQEVETKNKELTTNVMYLVKKNEFLNSVSKRLMSIISNLKEENKSPVQEIVYELQNSLDAEVWEEFEYRFQHVHSSFYDKLQENYPDLSPTERKLAALLKLNLTTKEIATIMAINTSSVEVSRSRLRKKLGITSRETNLVNFLNEI